MARVRPSPSSESIGRRLLHGRDDLAATALRLFFIELGSRRVHVAGCTPNPSPSRVIQQARQLSWRSAQRAERMRFLIRDRDQKFTHALSRGVRADGLEVVRNAVSCDTSQRRGRAFRAHGPQACSLSGTPPQNVTAHNARHRRARISGAFSRVCPNYISWACEIGNVFGGSWNLRRFEKPSPPPM